MLHLVLFVVFGFLSYRSAASIWQQRAVLREFRQTRALVGLALLFPAAPLLILVGSVVLPFPISFILAAGCFLSPLLVARKQSRALDTAGTDRVAQAQSAVQQTLGTSLAGLLYVAVSFALTAAPLFIGNYA